MKVVKIFVISLLIILGTITPAYAIKLEKKSELVEKNIYQDTYLFDDDVPIWEKGDYWTYSISDIELTTQQGEFEIELDIKIDDTMFHVAEVTADNYVVEFNTEINADFSVGINSVPLKVQASTANFPKSTINGEIVYDKSTLGIEEINIDIGLKFKLKILENPFLSFLSMLSLRVPLDINLKIEMDNPLELIDFPVNIFNIWGIESNEITISGEMKSFYFRIVKFADKIAKIFDMEFLPPEIADQLPNIDIGNILEMNGISNPYNLEEIENIFIVYDMEEVNVPAGTFDSYRIAPPDGLDALVYYHYSPEVGNLVDFEVTDLLYEYYPIPPIKIELVSTGEC